MAAVHGAASAHLASDDLAARDALAASLRADGGGGGGGGADGGVAGGGGAQGGADAGARGMREEEKLLLGADVLVRDFPH